MRSLPANDYAAQLKTATRIIREHAAQRDIAVVELYEPFENRADQLISGDFIHPNDAGYRVMAEAVIATLENLPDG